MAHAIYPKPYIYKGKAFLTISALALEADVAIPRLAKRMKMHPDLSIDEIVELCRKGSHTELYYKGHYYSRSKLAKLIAVAPSTLKRALERSPEMDVEEIVAELLSRKKNKEKGM